MVGLTEAIASFVVNTPPDDIPEAAIARARKGIADTVGVMLAGVSSQTAPPLLRYAARPGNGGSIPILGTGMTASPEVAALVNATLGHALDYDDVITLIPGHPSAVILAAVMSTFEAGKVDPGALLQAYVIGIEVGAKLGLGIGIGHYYRGWHATGTLGIFAAVTALARLQHFDVETTRRAIGIATSMASGVQRNFGTMMKPFHSGWAARNALVAAELATDGLEAAPDALESDGGFFAVYGDQKSDPSRAAAQLGRPYVLIDPGQSLKRYPCCYALHRPIEAILELRKAHGLTIENTDSVLCSLAPGGLKPLPYSRPKTGLQGKFSLEYALAASLLDGKIDLWTFSDEAVNRPEIQQLLPRMRTVEDPACAAEDPLAHNRSAGSRGFVTVQVTTRNGETVMARVDKPKGSPERELSWDDVREKYLDCAAQAGLAPARAERAFTMLADLGEGTDLTELLGLLRK